MISFVSFISLIPLIYKYYVPDSRKLGSKDTGTNKMEKKKKNPCFHELNILGVEIDTKKKTKKNPNVFVLFCLFTFVALL